MNCLLGRHAPVSVVIPCYNLGAYLEETVWSCLTQTLPPREIIIIDDGSTCKGTRQLLKKQRWPLCRVIRTKNRGLPAARNLGASKAAQPWLCFLDADDRLHHHFFAAAMEQAEADPGLRVISCWIKAFGDEDWVYRPQRCDLPELLAECSIATCALVHHSAFTKVGGFEQLMPHPGYEDWDFWINIATFGLPAAIMPEVLFYYRRRSGSMVEQCYYTEVHLTLMRYLHSKYQRHYLEHSGYLLQHQRDEIRELEQSAERLRKELERLALPVPPEPVSGARASSADGPLAELMQGEQHLLRLRRITKEMEQQRRRAMGR